MHPQDREHLVKSLNAKEHYSYEHQLRRKDGRLIWVRGSTQAVKNETGEIVRYLGIQEDITQERQIGAIWRAVERLRREIWTMRSERDIAQVLVAMRQVMETQEIPFTDCGINVIDDSTAPPTVRFHSMSPEGQWLQTSGHKGASRVLRFWREEHTVYRPDLQTDDPQTSRRPYILCCLNPLIRLPIFPSPMAPWPSTASHQTPSAPNISHLWKSCHPSSMNAFAV